MEFFDSDKNQIKTFCGFVEFNLFPFISFSDDHDDDDGGDDDVDEDDEATDNDDEDDVSKRYSHSLRVVHTPLMLEGGSRPVTKCNQRCNMEQHGKDAELSNAHYYCHVAVHKNWRNAFEINGDRPKVLFVRLHRNVSQESNLTRYIEGSGGGITESK